mgnify:CR=1 FL=1
MAKTAIIIGATGLTGSLLLQGLLEDNRYQKIKLFSRNTCNIRHPKIEEHLIDLFELEKQQHLFIADEVFCCIGTTKAKTPNEEQYLKIDYAIPATLAKLCSKMGIPTFLVISALGANKKSKIFYNRTKGRMEEEVLRNTIKNTYILQPSLIGGSRNEKRLGEKIAKLFNLKPSIFKSKTLTNLYHRNIIFIEKKIISLHEDLQYDYQLELEKFNLK